MKKSVALFGVLVLLMGLCGCSCLKSGGLSAGCDGVTVLDKVMALMEEQKSDEALVLIQDALSNDELVAEHPQLFATKLRILLTQDKGSEAHSEYLAVLKDSPDMAEAGYGIVEAWYEAREDWKGLEAWTDTIISSSLSPGTRADAFVRRIRAQSVNWDVPRLLDTMKRSMEMLDASYSVPVVSAVLDSAFSRNDLTMVQSSLSMLEALPSPPRAIAYLAISGRLRLMAAEKKWDDAMALFRKELPAMVNDESRRCYALMLSLAKSAAPSQSVDVLPELVLNVSTPSGGAAMPAARDWMDSVVQTGTADQMIQRLKKLMDLGFANERMASLLDKPFYKILLAPPSSASTNMVAILDTVLKGVKDDIRRGHLLQLRMDAYFLQNDLEGLIRLLEQGIPNQDKAWHEMVIAKAKGHLALQKGKRDDAVRYFREFMVLVEKHNEEESDPSTGLSVKPAWCLAKNAKRIGDILKEDGKAKEAAGVYQEAVNRYQVALSQYTKDSKEYTAITEEIKALPAKP